MAIFTDRLLLDHMSDEEDRTCREAFASLPEYVQRAIIDAGIVFAVADQKGNSISPDAKLC